MAAESQSFLDNVIAEFGRLERKMGPVTSKCPRFRPKALLALAVARTAADLRIGAAADSRSQVNGAMLRSRDLASEAEAQEFPHLWRRRSSLPYPDF